MKRVIIRTEVMILSVEMVSSMIVVTTPLNGNKKTYYFDVVWLFDWLDLPQPIQDFIVSRAALIVSTRIIGDPGQYNKLSAARSYTPVHWLWNMNQIKVTIVSLVHLRMVTTTTATNLTTHCIDNGSSNPTNS